MVKKNLAKSEQTGVALSVLLIETSPAHLKPRAEELDKRSKKQFAATMAAFSDATGGEDHEIPEDSE